jgi:hypothetical protein
LERTGGRLGRLLTAFFNINLPAPKIAERCPTSLKTWRLVVDFRKR